MSAPLNILVPIDFSKASKAVANFAIEVAEKLGANIKFLTVVEAPSPIAAEVTMVLPVEGMTYHEYAETHALETLVEFHGDLDTKGVKVDLAARTGLPRTAILEAAEEGGHDLIVMGTHGRTGIARLVLGSVAEYVVRHAGCPVTTVPAHG